MLIYNGHHLVGPFFSQALTTLQLLEDAVKKCSAGDEQTGMIEELGVQEWSHISDSYSNHTHGGR